MARPFHPCGGLVSRVVVAEAVELDGLELDPAARFEVIIALLE